MEKHTCVLCKADMTGAHLSRRYCNPACKRKFHRRASEKRTAPVRTHDCRHCGKSFRITSSQHNKWLCSDKCRKAQNSRHVREFHRRRPLAEAAYRAKHREKAGPDSNLLRFYRTNPDAPRACESCGEHRVLEVAHRPEYPRLGAWRSPSNCQWPKMVWVLCPTCHRLLDRMHYPPEDLGLV